MTRSRARRSGSGRPRTPPASRAPGRSPSRRARPGSTPVAWDAPKDEPASAVTARRIAGLFPDVRLIAMLRDLVERAISSYWQTVVLGDERRPLNEALDAELAPDALAAARPPNRRPPAHGGGRVRPGAAGLPAHLDRK